MATLADLLKASTGSSAASKIDNVDISDLNYAASKIDPSKSIEENQVDSQNVYNRHIAFVMSQISNDQKLKQGGPFADLNDLAKGLSKATKAKKEVAKKDELRRWQKGVQGAGDDQRVITEKQYNEQKQNEIEKNKIDGKINAAIDNPETPTDEKSALLNDSYGDRFNQTHTNGAQALTDFSEATYLGMRDTKLYIPELGQWLTLQEAIDTEAVLPDGTPVAPLIRDELLFETYSKLGGEKVNRFYLNTIYFPKIKQFLERTVAEETSQHLAAKMKTHEKKTLNEFADCLGSKDGTCLAGSQELLGTDGILYKNSLGPNKMAGSMDILKQKLDRAVELNLIDIEDVYSALSPDKLYWDKSQNKAVPMEQHSVLKELAVSLRDKEATLFAEKNREDTAIINGTISLKGQEFLARVNELYPNGATNDQYWGMVKQFLIDPINEDLQSKGIFYELDDNNLKISAIHNSYSTKEERKDDDLIREIRTLLAAEGLTPRVQQKINNISSPELKQTWTTRGNLFPNDTSKATKEFNTTYLTGEKSYVTAYAKDKGWKGDKEVTMTARVQTRAASFFSANFKTEYLVTGNYADAFEKARIATQQAITNGDFDDDPELVDTDKVINNQRRAIKIIQEGSNVASANGALTSEIPLPGEMEVIKEINANPDKFAVTAHPYYVQVAGPIKDVNGLQVQTSRLSIVKENLSSQIPKAEYIIQRSSQFDFGEEALSKEQMQLLNNKNNGSGTAQAFAGVVVEPTLDYIEVIDRGKTKTVKQDGEKVQIPATKEVPDSDLDRNQLAWIVETFISPRSKSNRGGSGYNTIYYNGKPVKLENQEEKNGEYTSNLSLWDIVEMAATDPNHSHFGMFGFGRENIIDLIRDRYGGGEALKGIPFDQRVQQELLLDKIRSKAFRGQMLSTASAKELRKALKLNKSDSEDLYRVLNYSLLTTYESYGDAQIPSGLVNFFDAPINKLHNLLPALLYEVLEQ